MNKSIFVFLVLCSLLFLGCINLSVEQKVEKDGTSLVTQTIDMSGLVAMVKQYAQSATTTTTQTTIQPDATFKLTDYSSYPTPSSKGIIIDVNPEDSYNAGSSYTSLQLFFINNNPYQIKNIVISTVKSYAFVKSTYSSATTINLLGAGNSTTKTVYFQVADVPAGTYPAVFVISFYDNNNAKQTVAYTINLVVKEKQTIKTTSTADALANLEEVGKETCANMTKKDPDLSCNYSAEGIMTLSKRVTPKDGKYEFKTESKFPYIYYIFKTEQLPPIADTSAAASASSLGSTSSLGSASSLTSQTSSKFNSPTAKTSAATLKLANAKITYTIEMPGELVSSGVGEIKKGKAVFDVTDLMDKGNIVEIESRELDVVLLAALGVAGLIVLGGVAFLLFGRKSSTV